MPKIELKLYITGETVRSRKAVGDLESLCKLIFKEEVALETIDVMQRPDLAHDERIVATPTLIKKLPLPVRRIIGDLSDKEKVLVALDLVMNGYNGRNGFGKDKDPLG